MMHDREPVNWKVLIPTAVVFLLALTLFTKFAVVDRLSGATRMEQEAQECEKTLEGVQQRLESYDQVEAEYNRYFSDALTADDMPLECMDILKLLEEHLMSEGKVSSFQFAGSTLSLQITVDRLDDTSKIIAELSREPSVASVDLYTADNGTEMETSGKASVMMTITLQEVTEE